jgi:hypothetical protein
MSVVYMGIYTEKSFEYGFYHGKEVFGEWNTWTKGDFLPIWDGNKV